MSLWLAGGFFGGKRTDGLERDDLETADLHGAVLDEGGIGGGKAGRGVEGKKVGLEAGDSVRQDLEPVGLEQDFFWVSDDGTSAIFAGGGARGCGRAGGKQLTEAWVRMAPLSGMPFCMTTSKAETLSEATKRRVLSSTSKTSRTLPWPIFLTPARSTEVIRSVAAIIDVEGGGGR